MRNINICFSNSPKDFSSVLFLGSVDYLCYETRIRQGCSCTWYHTSYWPNRPFPHPECLRSAVHQKTQTQALEGRIYDVHESSISNISGTSNWASVKASEYNDKSTCSCLLQQEKDSKQHWITQCQASTFPRTRADYISQVKGTIGKEGWDEDKKTAH